MASDAVPPTQNNNAEESGNAAEPVAPEVAAVEVAAPVAAVADASQLGLAPSSPQPLGIASTASPQKSGVEKGGVRQALDMKYERLNGKVVRYDATNGFGVAASDLFPGELVFRADRVMPEFQNHPFQEGEGIEFDVQADDHGRPHAVMLKPYVNRNSHDCLGQRHRGYVRRCAERWGFLNSAAFDGDLFVHRDNLLVGANQVIEGQPPLRNGQPVEFDVALDDRGRAVARQITTHALPRPADWIGNRMRGHVRSFQGAWGFIVSDRFAGDLFVHRDSFMQQYQGIAITVGTIVEFDVERDTRRKGTKDRLVARRVSILAAGEQPMVQPMAQPMAQPMDPAAYMSGAMNQQMAQMYYPQMGIEQQMAGQAFANPYAASPYAQMQQPLMPQMQPQQLLPQMQQPLMPQQPYQLPATAQMPVSYLPAGVAPATEVAPPMTMGQPVAAALPAMGAVPTMGAPLSPQKPAELPTSPSADGQGLLHITMHDWEPDQPGQLWVTKGTLVNVSYRAAHGWVYAATANPGSEAEPANEGWLPQAVVKRVSLCRVAMDWPAEGTGTLGVSKGEVIAVSKEAERGWVYGERIGPRQPDRPADGWLPKKVLDYLQS